MSGGARHRRQGVVLGRMIARVSGWDVSLDGTGHQAVLDRPIADRWHAGA